jgi:hypothetical protein
MSPSEPPETPRLNQAWVDDACDMWKWNGAEWVPFEDLPYFSPTSLAKDDV